jgi:hypothetical protein
VYLESNAGRLAVVYTENTPLRKLSIDVGLRITHSLKNLRMRAGTPLRISASDGM